jgi:hypothetical protein
MILQPISLQPSPWYPIYKNVTSLFLYTPYKTGHFYALSVATYVHFAIIFDESKTCLSGCLYVCVCVQIYMHLHVTTCIN